MSGLVLVTPESTESAAGHGEMVNILFGYRGRPLGRIVLNRSIIPMLCRKAGVPGNDVRDNQPPRTLYHSDTTL
jgi:hypothetical protein